MQTLKVFLSLLLCSIIQVSCSPLYHEPAENNIKHSLTNPEDGSYEIIWEKTDTQMFDNRNNSMIVISQGVVFLEGASTENSELYLFALDAVTGAEIWRREVFSSPAQLLVTGTMLFRGTGGAGHLQAYDTSTGQLLWNTALPRAHTVVKLYSYDENIFVNTNDDAFFVLDKEGEILRAETSSETIFFETSSISYQGESNTIEAVDRSSRKLIWHVDFEPGIGYSPIFTQDSVYFRTSGISNNIIYSIDRISGSVNWQLSTNALSNLSITDSKLLYVSTDGDLVVLDRTLGQEIERVKFSPPFKINGYVGRYYVSTDSFTDFIVVSFGDNNQVLTLRPKP